MCSLACRFGPGLQSGVASAALSICTQTGLCFLWPVISELLLLCVSPASLTPEWQEKECACSEKCSRINPGPSCAPLLGASTPGRSLAKRRRPRAARADEDEGAGTITPTPPARVRHTRLAPSSSHQSPLHCRASARRFRIPRSPDSHPPALGRRTAILQLQPVHRFNCCTKVHVPW